MLNKSIRVLNFDDSIIKQKRLLASYKSEIIDLRDVGPKARFWLSAKDREEIVRRIRHSDKNAVTLTGSGDFHQVTNILISQFDEPISVIDFDYHPDWYTLPPRLSCGSWVTETLKDSNILKYVLIGASSDDVSSFSIQYGNFAALKDDRLEIYPYSHCPSVVFFKDIPRNISMEVKRYPFFAKIYWNELKNVNLMEFFLHVLRRIPSKKVYLTIDKDCLKKGYALTNWEEGRLPLEELLTMLKMVKENLDIIGVDITGDHSAISISGAFKRVASYLDHPRDFSAKGASDPDITRINEDTNLKIMKILTGSDDI